MYLAASIQNIAMKTYLVTGAAGFIGANFVKYMLKKYDDIAIVILDKLTYAGNLANLRDLEGRENYTFVKRKIAGYDLILRLFGSRR